jgi:hypothetical protein
MAMRGDPPLVLSLFPGLDNLGRVAPSDVRRR